MLCSYILITLALIAMLSACAAKTAPPPKPLPPVKKQVQPKPPNPEAQQHYYNLGLKHYANENYKEAKKAFQQAVDNGADTNLGVKARENLKKIEQIMKTLKEME